MNFLLKILYLITLLLTLTYTNIYSADISIKNIEESITTIEKALNKASDYLGFDSLINMSNKSSINHQLITLENDQTPFLGDSLEGKRVWNVIYQNVVLNQAKSYEGDNYEREIHVYIDSLTGRLIKIFSPYKGNDNMKMPNRELRFTEEILAPHEEYLGFVEEGNFIPLNCLLGSKYPMDLLSNEFSAILINYRFQGLKGWHELPVWMITSWGREYIETDDETNVQNGRTRSYCVRRICQAETCQVGGFIKILGP